MEPFEKFFKDNTKNLGFFIKKNETDTFPDFVLYNRMKTCMVEVKNRIKFSKSDWKKKQPSQFKTYCNLPHAYTFLLYKNKTKDKYFLYKGFRKVLETKDFKEIKSFFKKFMATRQESS